MAQALAAAFDASLPADQQAEVQFDQGAEVRFLQHVFSPRRQGADPSWICISDLTPKGMVIETAVPLTVRTAPSTPKGARPVAMDRKGSAVALEGGHRDLGRFLHLHP